MKGNASDRGEDCCAFEDAIARRPASSLTSIASNRASTGGSYICHVLVKLAHQVKPQDWVSSLTLATIQTSRAAWTNDRLEEVRCSC